MFNEEEEEDKEMILQKKVKAFFDLGVKVHITYKDGFWKRGFIKEVGADFFILDEAKEGELPVFFLEILKIEKYTERWEVKNGDNK